MSNSHIRRRREEDTCMMKRWWKWATPYVQIIGFFIVAIPTIYATTVLTAKAQDFDGRLTTTERNYLQISTKLDTAIFLLRRK